MRGERRRANLNAREQRLLDALRENGGEMTTAELSEPDESPQMVGGSLTELVRLQLVARVAAKPMRWRARVTLPPADRARLHSLMSRTDAGN